MSALHEAIKILRHEISEPQQQLGVGPGGLNLCLELSTVAAAALVVAGKDDDGIAERVRREHLLRRLDDIALALPTRKACCMKDDGLSFAPPPGGAQGFQT